MSTRQIIRSTHATSSDKVRNFNRNTKIMSALFYVIILFLADWIIFKCDFLSTFGLPVLLIIYATSVLITLFSIDAITELYKNRRK